MPFDWSRSASYDTQAKEAFHRAAKRALKKLANDLGFASSEYDLRSNKAGVAVSGEVTLHHDDLYIQVSQPAFGSYERGVLIRTCEGRKDYTGGRNQFAPLEWLDSEDGRLASLCQQVLEQKRGFNADERPEHYNAYTSTPVFNR